MISQSLRCSVHFFVTRFGQFGRLTALYPTGERDYKESVIWRCACKCGCEIHISQERLMRKNTQSCDCLKKETQENVGKTLPRADIAGITWYL